MKFSTVMFQDGKNTGVDVPEDLRSSIDGAGLAAAWDKLAPRAKKAHVAKVVEAKTAETRARRIIAILVTLGG